MSSISVSASDASSGRCSCRSCYIGHRGAVMDEANRGCLVDVATGACKPRWKREPADYCRFGEGGCCGRWCRSLGVGGQEGCGTRLGGVRRVVLVLDLVGGVCMSSTSANTGTKLVKAFPEGTVAFSADGSPQECTTGDCPQRRGCRLPRARRQTPGGSRVRGHSTAWASRLVFMATSKCLARPVFLLRCVCGPWCLFCAKAVVVRFVVVCARHVVPV